MNYSFALGRTNISFGRIGNQPNNENNPLEIPPHALDDLFDEVVSRPSNRILRDYSRLDHFNCESSVGKSPVAANNF